MGEIWKPIPNYPGYEASNLGRIKRKQYKEGLERRGKPLTRVYPELILRASYHDYNDKDLSVRVHKKGYYGVKVISLVGLAWFGTKDVEHISEDIEDNRVSNLRLKTKER